MKRIAFVGAVWLCPLVALMGQDVAQPPAPKPVPVKVDPVQAAPSTFEETESVWSLSALYWRPGGKVNLKGGEQSPDPAAQTFDDLGKPKYVPGVILTAPTGHANRLEISAFEARGSGSATASQDYNYFGQGFDKGTFLTSEYKLRDLKVSWNYLTYPYPPLASRFRVKTLWELQYVSISSAITAPYTATQDTAADRGTGKRKIILPTLGLGVELIPSLKHFRVEAKASAFALPGKSQIWDAEAAAIVRFWHIEIFAGGKAFHFRTSPKDSEFLEGNLWGPYGGLRWVFR